MRVHNHLTHMLPLLQSSDTGVRRQACYTLAAIGGEYATAVFGTIVLDKTHLSHLYAIESLRHLYHNNRAPLRTAIIRWLLQAICESNEMGQACALESLIFLLWQAHKQRKSTYWHNMSKEVLQHESIQHVLQSQHASIRQKAIQLLGLSSSYLNTIGSLHPLLLCMLRSDRDPQIRAGVANLCKIMKARWALPDLLQALLDPDTNVAQAALTSLETIATAKDATVLCTLTEITHLHTTTDPVQLDLASRARLLLQKWQEVAPTGLVLSAEKLDMQNL
jgi:HEAT repeat protein